MAIGVVADCEYGWNLGHEDLEDAGIELEPNQTVPRFVEQNGFDSHGTAVLGEVSGQDNGYGVTGIAPDAEVRVFPEYSQEEGGRPEQPEAWYVDTVTPAFGG